MPEILERNRNMTMQEMFNISATHLLLQGEKSAITEEESGRNPCRYRGPRGLQCAFGPFIPDSLYTKHMEGKMAANDLVWTPTCLPFELTGFANRLQSIHDHINTYMWRESLERLAAQWGLTMVDVPIQPWEEKK